MVRHWAREKQLILKATKITAILMWLLEGQAKGNAVSSLCDQMDSGNIT